MKQVQTHHGESYNQPTSIAFNFINTITLLATPTLERPTYLCFHHYIAIMAKMADENTPNDSVSSQSDRDSSQPRQRGRRPLPNSPRRPHQPDLQPSLLYSGLRHPHASMSPPHEERSEESEQGQHQPPPPPAGNQQPNQVPIHVGRVTCPICIAANGQCNLPALQNLLLMTEASLVRCSGFIPMANRHSPFYRLLYGSFLAYQEGELVRLAEGLRHVVEDLQMRHPPGPREGHGAGFRRRFRGRIRRNLGRLIGR